MRTLLIALSTALVTAATAHAGGADDGNAGLQALKGGDYDRAVTLFTRALASGELSREDQEFALANRGRAYAKIGRIGDAIDDLDQARHMKPDDADAQTDLVALITTRLPADQIPQAPKPGFWDSLGKALAAGVAVGILAGVAGSAGQ